MMTAKERRSIELARRFIGEDLFEEDSSVDETHWRSWLPVKMVSLRDDQLATVRRYSDGQQHIAGEAMFLLHHGHGITLPQVEASGFACDDVVDYARLLCAYRYFAVQMATWREDLLYKMGDKWCPMITLQELREGGDGNLAAILNASIIEGWIEGKNGLPPGVELDAASYERYLQGRVVER